MNRNNIFQIVARGVELLLGGVFLAGAVLKALDVNLFTLQIRAYGVFTNPSLLAASAVGTLLVETALGMALLLGLRLRGWTYAAVAALLLVFSALIAYGWLYHDLEDCGCFGRMEMSPRVSLAKNVFLLAMTVLAWAGWRRRAAVARLTSAVLARASACGVAAVCLALYACVHLEPAVKVTEENRPFAQFVFEADGMSWDLGRGEYFVAMLSATCEHCMASIPAVNALAATPGFPPIVGLCYEEEPGSFEEFRALTSPAFALHSLGSQGRLFSSFIGQEPPRFIYIRDGRQVAYWDQDVPGVAAVLKARESASAN